MSYAFTPETIPSAYTKITWEDRLERTKYDYGNPEHTYKSPYPPGDELETIAEWERMGVPATY